MLDKSLWKTPCSDEATSKLLYEVWHFAYSYIFSAYLLTAYKSIISPKNHPENWSLFFPELMGLLLPFHKAKNLFLFLNIFNLYPSSWNCIIPPGIVRNSPVVTLSWWRFYSLRAQGIHLCYTYLLYLQLSCGLVLFQANGTQGRQFSFCFSNPS